MRPFRDYLAALLPFLSLAVITAPCASAHAQTTVALSGFGAVTNSTTPGNANFYRMNPATQAGGLLEVRHVFDRYFGFEGSYSVRRANEVYNEEIAIPVGGCPTSGCNPSLFTYTIPAFAQELTADWVSTGRIGNFHPFVLAGVGLLLTHPTSSAGGAMSTSQAALDYGVGVDWGFASHLGLRLQFRGDLYKAPGIAGNSTNYNSAGWMNTSEPALGISYKF